MSDCEEKIYSNDYVDFIISKDVLDVIDLPSDCIQRIEEENDTYFYPRSFFQIFDFFWSKVLPIMGCNIEESDNDLVVFEGVNSSNIFYVQPFTLSWSHKGKDVFSGIIEHGQIWGIFQFLQHRVGGNTVGFCIGNIAIVTDDGKNVACVLVHHQ